MVTSDLATQIRDLEEQLFRPETRQSPDKLAELLADDFLEFGASGRIFNKQQVVDGLLLETPIARTMKDFELRLLAPNISLATYQVMLDAETPLCSLRSSIWKHMDNRWQMVFHQGTSIVQPRGKS